MMNSNLEWLKNVVYEVFDCAYDRGIEYENDEEGQVIDLINAEAKRKAIDSRSKEGCKTLLGEVDLNYQEFQEHLPNYLLPLFSRIMEHLEVRLD